VSDIKYIIGIDEVGRGPIAGPVTLGSFVFLDHKVKKKFKGVKESKQLSEKKREEWFAVITEAKNNGKVDFAVDFQSSKIIDSKGIVFAINKSLAIVLKKLNLKPSSCRVLLDGGLRAPIQYRDQKTIIKGDEKEMVIALASICAKVTRDRYMKKISKKYNNYDFDIHKGYGTKKHYVAIKKHGLTDIHRRTFISGIND
jgi:ribonuclease HII